MQYATAKITIATDNDESAAVEIDSPLNLVGIFMPSGFDGTKLRFESATPATQGDPANPSSTWVPVVDTAGAAVEFTVAASTFIAIPPSTLAGVRHLKLKTVTAQSADRSFVLCLRESPT